MRRELVVVVDKDVKPFNTPAGTYFARSKNRRQGEFTIETPIGGRRELEGELILDPDFNYHTSEYLYVELDATCNFSCRGCGVGNGITHLRLEEIIAEDAQYVTKSFVESLAAALSGPYPADAGVTSSRKLFYGGGEPLIGPERFSWINHQFENIKNTTRVVITNGCSLPLDYGEFKQFVENAGIEYIFLTYSAEHARQYATLGHERVMPAYIPANCLPEVALKEKIAIIGKHCKKLGIGFTGLVLEDSRNGENLLPDLRDHIIKHASDIYLHTIAKDGRRDPCSQAREMAIRANGDIYPHCYDIFNGTNRIGVAGFLVGGGNGS